MPSNVAGSAGRGPRRGEVPSSEPSSRFEIDFTDDETSRSGAAGADQPVFDHRGFEEPRLSFKNAPGQLADRLGFSPFTVVVGGLAVIAAAVAAWWAFATPAPAPEVVLPIASEVSIPSVTSAAPSPIVIHVDGAVKVPGGVHELAPGSRVIDAVEAAGGLDAQADRSRINLALRLVDQQRVWVPRVGEDAGEVVPGDVGDPAVGGGVDNRGVDNRGLVDVNHADAATLQTLPGVGPVIAAAIIEHRESKGAFVALDDLMDVTGIGPAKLEQLQPFART